MSEKPVSSASVLFVFIVLIGVIAWVFLDTDERLDRIEAQLGISQQEPAR